MINAYGFILAHVERYQESGKFAAIIIRTTGKVNLAHRPHRYECLFTLLYFLCVCLPFALFILRIRCGMLLCSIQMAVQ